MTPHFGYSSEIYEISPQDLISLKDCESTFAAKIKTNEDVVILLGNRNLGQDDTLVRGREIVRRAIEKNEPYIPVRIVFTSVIPAWNLLPLFIKKFRYQYKYFNNRIYHLSARRLREQGLERCRRTSNNAYAITNKRWAISEQERQKKYQKLVNSLQNGFSDEYPISIMLCRSMGAKDSIDNGHHRMGICLEYGIDHICTNFIAAGAAPRWFQKICLKFSKKNSE